MTADAERKPFHERVAETLIAQLEKGTAPWQRPWAPGETYLPMNPVSGTRYRGINTVLLLAQGRSDPRWMTYRQALSQGAQVQKNEKGTSVQYWKFAEQQLERDAAGKPIVGEDGQQKKVWVEFERPRVFHAVVFNADQIDGLPALTREPRIWDASTRAETILRNSGASITHGGDRAFYSVAKDVIRLPQEAQFESAANYYATALHELGHWTGHPSRLDRDLVHVFGSEGYAREELRAEIASLILGDEIGLGHDPGQHAAYVGHWIKVLREDSLEIFRAAAAAEKIHDFVLRFEQQHEQTHTVEIKQEGRTAMNDATTETVSAEGQALAPRMYLAVPYAEREAAKAAGARWDRSQRSWYVPAGVETAAFVRWLSDSPSLSTARTPTPTENRLYLVVPYRERHDAYAAGALWDASAKSWYVAADAPRDGVQRWLSRGSAYEQLPAMAARDELAAALRDMGLVVTDGHPTMDGKSHRLTVEGDRKGERSGFYVAHEDGHPAAYIKNHRTGEEARWKAKGYSLGRATHAELVAEAQAKQDRRATEREQTYEATAARLAKRIAGLTPATLPTAYMQSKGIGTHPGVYTDDARTTYVPAIDASGKLWSIQYVDAEGKKRFAKSSRKQGCFHAIGGLAGLAAADVLVIAEGYATAATCTELLGKPVVAAFDAGNLQAVAEALHAKHPDKPVLIVADDDQAQEQQRGQNPGRDKAQQAANAVQGRVVLPIFAPGEQLERPKQFSDFNDLAVRSVLGREGAAAQLRHAYQQALHTRAQPAVIERPKTARATQSRARSL
jgi:putative DNA primase/helicase